jgi:UDP-2,3-diacylglucosamine pyrophosphatase LpxH
MRASRCTLAYCSKCGHLGRVNGRQCIASRPIGATYSCLLRLQQVNEFCELYVISDLHLGGKAPHQAFREGAALAGLFEYIRERASQRPVALVLNGDVLDFLAEPGAEEFTLAPGAALERIRKDSTFKAAFDALATLTTARAVQLHIATGNHDIELALPSARRALLGFIAPDADRERRVHFHTDGTGLRMRVAGKEVYITHGNEADAWNQVDHEGLREAVAAATRGSTLIDAPRANPGTTLVIRVMNAIKHDYPVVDLLKPETAPLMAVLNALDPEKSTRGMAAAFGRRLANGEWASLLSLNADAEPVMGAEREVLAFLQQLRSPSDVTRQELERVEEIMQAPEAKAPLDLVLEHEQRLGAALNSLSAWVMPRARRLTRGTKRAALLASLRGWLREDDTFDLRKRDETFDKVMGRVGGDIDVIITGHTHLPRWIQSGKQTYLNTGTWMRLMALRSNRELADEERFGKVFDAMSEKGKGLTAIDALDEQFHFDPRFCPVALVDDQGARLQSVIKASHDATRFVLAPLRWNDCPDWQAGVA